MSYSEYNVAYHDSHGNLRLTHTTWTREEIARKRKAKFDRAGGCVTLVGQPDGTWVKEKTPAMLVVRTISDPQVVDDAD